MQKISTLITLLQTGQISPAMFDAKCAEVVSVMVDAQLGKLTGPKADGMAFNVQILPEGMDYKPDVNDDELTGYVLRKLKAQHGENSIQAVDWLSLVLLIIELINKRKNGQAN